MGSANGDVGAFIEMLAAKNKAGEIAGLSVVIVSSDGKVTLETVKIPDEESIS